MKKLLSFAIIGLALLLSSCIEIIDDITINSDGSGQFRYNINLSGSRVKINSILALDSLDGKKVPSIQEISARIAKVTQELEDQEGVTNVTITEDYDNFIFKLSCDFISIEKLQAAVKAVIVKELGDEKYPELQHNWMDFENKQLTRKIPPLTLQKTQELDESEKALLKEGVYTSITRFDTTIVKCQNEKALLSKNQKAVMLKTDPYSLVVNPNLLDNVIYLSEEQD